jgi:hypothetical protein
MAKKKSTKQRKEIKRTTRHFQLRTEHPHDQHVREILDYGKSQRREVYTNNNRQAANSDQRNHDSQ